MAKNYKKIKDKKQTLAIAIIRKLFKLVNSAELVQKNQKITISEPLKTRYLQLIQQISMKLKVKQTRLQKLKYCKKCHSHINPKNSKHRIKNKLIITCYNCGHKKNIHITKGKE